MLKVEIKESYYSVVSKNDIKKGDIVLFLKGIIKNKPNKYSLQLKEGEHLYPHSDDANTMQELVWPYLNHSCEPNTKMDVNTLQLIALKNIQSGEEITFDYNTTEWDMSTPFQCNCGSKHCKGLIKGKKHLTAHRKYAES